MSVAVSPSVCVHCLEMAQLVAVKVHMQLHLTLYNPEQTPANFWSTMTRIAPSINYSGGQRFHD